ncbi:MAG TPA: GNAT family N-acetyltransferase [Frankiaceae bacterium]|jgi:GNAT superfamily N-acetyltransferase|nr:GNAT family N-acetyltransferase [Frankiaceae bacterium]
MSVMNSEAPGSIDAEVGDLAGQQTLLACWNALAGLSPGARLVQTEGAAVAVFPSWAPLNNAVLVGRHDQASEMATADAVRRVYAAAGVPAWALWRSSPTADLDGADARAKLGALTRDTTTLVMQLSMPPGLEFHEAVIPASIDTVARFDEESRMTSADVGTPDDVPGLYGWAILHEGEVASMAWSYEYLGECGVYAVETLPRFRRRGLATSLMRHLLAAAQERGAQTATLQSTRMGQPLYASLGFTPQGRYEEWIWR